VNVGDAATFEDAAEGVSASEADAEGVEGKMVVTIVRVTGAVIVDSESIVVMGTNTMLEVVGAASAEEAVAVVDEDDAPLPVNPPVAPVAAIRASASSWVSHPMLVPALFTSGRAKQEVPAAHCWRDQVPATHCAKEPEMHAWSPSMRRSVRGAYAGVRITRTCAGVRRGK
jgi:hypothetical protein